MVGFDQADKPEHNELFSELMRMGLRDLLLFFAFAGFPIAGFLLEGVYSDAIFYAVLTVLFLVILVWLRQYHNEHHFKGLVDYDENLHFQSFLWIGAGIMGAFVAASLVVAYLPVAGQKISSVIWVPVHQAQLTFPGTAFALSAFWSDILFQLVLVAPAEELCKLVLSLALYIKLRGTFSHGTAAVASIAIPIFFWSMLHVYRAYTGPLQVSYLVAAFIGGLVFFAVMKTTRSLLAAILTHFGYNALVFYLYYQNQAQVAGAIIMLGKWLETAWVSLI